MSKLTTSNLGNDALSSELIRSAQAALNSDASLEVRDRPYELGIEPRVLECDNIDGFVETAATRHALLARRLPTGPVQRTVQYPRVGASSPTTEKNRPSRLASLRKALLRPLRPLRSAWRATALQGIEAYVFSGAGAVRDQPACVEHLIEMRAAQLLGIPTAAVCQSINVLNPGLQKALGNVYSGCKRIVVRGEESRRRLGQLGLDLSRVSIAADTVWLCTQTVSTAQRRLAFLNPTSPTIASGVSSWVALAKTLRANGHHVVLGTSDALADRVALETVRDAIGSIEIRQFSSYQGFLREMGNVSIVVAGRMHACVMALRTNVPVVCPVFGDGDIRMTEVFADGPAVAVHATRGWEERISLAPQAGQEDYCGRKALSASQNADAIASLVAR
ncbi:MAG: polysaccharide pyruvyl transferase family protein [Deltaproteobacteria bacterium]|nr:polysaccharide pyruvyl transferase family protein [Deltaproteobacteria bacterium]